MDKPTKENLTPYEKYEAMTKFPRKPKEKRKRRTLEAYLLELEKHCCVNEAHLLQALRYTRKILSKKHGN